MKIDIVVEIPKNSNIKYEFDRKTKQIRVDRILYGSNTYPLNYGFVENTLDWDGDELDAFVIADQSFLPGIIVPCRIIGAIEMIDNGETDTKLLCVIDCDPRYDHINKMGDVNKNRLLEIKDFFENYKNLQNKKVIIKDFKDYEWALKELNVSKELMLKYSNLEKDEFIRKMKSLHPEKYL